MKYLLLLLPFLATTFSSAMELTPQCATLSVGKSPLESLHSDLLKLVLTNMLTDDKDKLAWSIMNIKTLAATNRFFNNFVNRTETLKFIINGFADLIENVDELDIAPKFEKMPGMKNPEIQLWLADRKEKIPTELAFIDAVIGYDVPTIARFIKNGVNVDSKSKISKLTALSVACRNHGHIETMQLLIDSGANINLPSGRTSKITPLYATTLASDNKKTSISILLKAGANPNIATNALLRTPLISLAATVLEISYDKDSIDELLKAGADINAQDILGYTALMWTAHYGHIGTMSILLAAGANPDTQDNDGNTALIWATYNCNVNTIKTLLVAGAKKDMRSKTLGTALELAQKERFYEIEQLLLQYGAQQTTEKK